MGLRHDGLHARIEVGCIGSYGVFDAGGVWQRCLVVARRIGQPVRPDRLERGFGVGGIDPRGQFVPWHFRLSE